MQEAVSGLHFALAVELSQLLIELGFFFADAGGCYDCHSHDLVCPFASAQALYALSTQSECATGLGSGGDLHLGLSGDGGYGDLISQNRLRDADRLIQHDVVSFSVEDVILFLVD